MDYICYRKKLGEVEVRKFVRQIISAVHYLHQGGVIHRYVLQQYDMMEDWGWMRRDWEGKVSEERGLGTNS